MSSRHLPVFSAQTWSTKVHAIRRGRCRAAAPFDLEWLRQGSLSRVAEHHVHGWQRNLAQRPKREGSHRAGLPTRRELETYLTMNAAALVTRSCYRAGLRIATSSAESAVNSLVNARMNKRRQMRWSPHGAHRVLQVRAAVIDGRCRSVEGRGLITPTRFHSLARDVVDRRDVVSVFPALPPRQEISAEPIVNLDPC